MKLGSNRILLLLGDIVIVFISYSLAAFLRFEGNIPEGLTEQHLLCIAASVLTVFTLNILFGNYKDIWKYAGIYVLFRQAVVVMGNVAVLLAMKFLYDYSMSSSIAVIHAIILFMLMSGIRIFPRTVDWAMSLLKPESKKARRAVIVGAGDTGAALIRQAYEGGTKDGIFPVALIDNDKKKLGLKVGGVKVAGDLDAIEEVCKKFQATEIIVAIPGATKEELYDIYRKCIKTNLPIKSSRSLIDVKDYMQEDDTALKSVTIEDLLFRSVVETDMTPVKEYIKDRVVMVTGGAGSIGSELCRQILTQGCGLLVIFDINENGLYEINEELSASYDESRYALCLGSIRDISRLNYVIGKYKPFIVFHAAAHKHVPMLELNPFEAVKNNVIGTMNAVEACIQNNVEKFILISTDKAVNPVNVLGASKRIAELIVEHMKNRGTELTAVRFGNVLGSIGSVIPKFKTQIAAGGPVTITHRDISRYFMTISEAVSLVLTAGTLAKDGEIYVLDMGQPVKIYDLATDLIRLSGYEPGTDIEIKEIGLRPGEKLYEELFLDSEKIDATSHEKLFILKSEQEKDFETHYKKIKELTEEGKNEKQLRNAMFEFIDGETRV